MPDKHKPQSKKRPIPASPDELAKILLKTTPKELQTYRKFRKLVGSDKEPKE